MKLLMISSIFSTLLLTNFAHPMLMIILISTQTLIICLTLMAISPTSWFSFILFLVFMGGLMVLFIYISSLASNEKFELNIQQTLPSLLFSSLIIMSMLLFLINNPSIKNFLNSNTNLIIKIYSTNNMFLTSLTMIFLLLALVIIVKITTLKEGPLRQLK